MKIVPFLFLVSSLAIAKDPYPKNSAIDIQHYVFQLEVNDSTNIIAGRASVTVLFKYAVKEFELDLAQKKSTGSGMEVSGVQANGKELTYQHANDRLKILLPVATRENEVLTFDITYHGIPQDGLIIGTTKFGDRGFFGDNWPNRGHHWLPVIDHPSDKASVEFVITAPLQYSVVANGLKKEESLIGNNRKLTHWHEEVPIPVKVMVAGIARFAVQYVGKVDDISVESWVYPQNRENGFHDYAVALPILDYFHHHIGPYPFKKLANVQSKTKFGGLENANTIFYFENSVNGKGEREGLIAHEEAHQWFGDSASEDDWHHVWLSEGFATYFASLYLEHAHGRQRLVAEQQADREQVTKFYEKNKAPIIDTTITDINKVLNTNTYQKAGWVLHMLRHQVGNEIFWKGIRQYYATFRGRNAMTSDFIRIMQEASGQDLSAFFQQWLYQGGHPVVTGSWRYDARRKSVVIDIEQTQANLFRFPMELKFLSQGSEEEKQIMVTSRKQQFIVPVTALPADVILDPGTWLLFEGKITKK